MALDGFDAAYDDLLHPEVDFSGRLQSNPYTNKYLRKAFRAIFGRPPWTYGMATVGTTPEWPVQIFPDNFFNAYTWLRRYFEHPRSHTSREEVENYRVSKVVHYKETHEKLDHEFLVATVLDTSRTPAGDEPPPSDACLDLLCERHGDRPRSESSLSPLGTLSPLGAWSGNSSNSTSILLNRPITRVDKIFPVTPYGRQMIDEKLEKGKMLKLREMTFEENPTVLDLAVVLEAHSALSTSYRLHATMCYWFAGSTYEIFCHLYNGKNVNSPTSKKRGKFGWFTMYAGYSLMMETKAKEGMRAMAKLVAIFEWFGRSKKRDQDSDLELEEVEKELRNIPTFEDLCERSKERKVQVELAIWQRERLGQQSREHHEQITEQRRNHEEQIKALKREQEVRDKERERERAERVAIQRELEATKRQVEAHERDMKLVMERQMEAHERDMKLIMERQMEAHKRDMKLIMEQMAALLASRQEK